MLRPGSATVVVENRGRADAGSFAVRLAVDDDQGDVEEKSASGLEAGKERAVGFDDVRLPRGLSR